MPARRHSATASGTPGAERIGEGQQPEHPEREAAECSGGAPAPRSARATARTRSPRSANAVDLSVERPAGVRIPSGQRGHGLGGALGRERHSARSGAGEGHDRELRGERVLAEDRPRRRPRARPAELQRGLVHRVEALAWAGERGSLAQLGDVGRSSAGRPGEAVVNSTTFIRFSVSVPVLSEQSTVAAPSVSSAAIRRARTLLRAIRYAPRARKMVTTTGNSSGRARWRG